MAKCFDNSSRLGHFGRMANKPSRLPWVDHLRTFVILLVVSQHACVTYSHIGSWYAMSAHEPSPLIKYIFVLWQAHLQAFFMGVMFFLAGYFAHFSITRRGPAKFLAERAERLGLPTLFYMLVLHPFILLGLNPWFSKFPPFRTFYPRYVLSGNFIGSSGPLWFAFALLIFCAVLVLRRAIFTRRPEAANVTAPPGAKQLWLFGLVLVLTTFLVRTVQPLGTSMLNFQFCYFPQYIAAFIVGLRAARHQWLTSLAASPTARRAGWWAIICGPIAITVVIVASGALAGKGSETLSGGWHWASLGLSAWEQLSGLGLALGLMAWFSSKLNYDTPWLHWLSRHAFGVYVLHAPVLVALTIAFRPLETHNALLLAALLTVSGLFISYILAGIALRIPGLRAIL